MINLLYHLYWDEKDTEKPKQFHKKKMKFDDLY